MFEFLRRKKYCIFCDVELPKNFKVITPDYFGYCSIECSKLEEEYAQYFLEHHDNNFPDFLDEKEAEKNNYFLNRINEQRLLARKRFSNYVE